MFEWQFIYIEVAHRSSDQHILFGVTEKDLVSIMQKLRQKARVEGQTVSTNLLHKEMSREKILELVLDCFLMDAETFEVSLSMINLSTRHAERSKLEEQFTMTGGSFIQLIKGEDPELAAFTTNIPQTELK